MKLVEILARQLKAWPEGRECCVQSGEDTEIYFDGGGPDDLYVDGRAVDGGLCGARVTREQWQAAVDALKAKEVVEWNGEGLPPVGAVCEYRDSLGAWEKVEITAIARNGICFVEDSHGGENYAPKDPAAFRPIRTPEQIAAEEIQRIRDEIGYQRPQLGPCPVEQMYLLGYRKFEIVEGE